MAIDIIDERLIEVLQENARISISELSKRINLSLSAVSDRLKKLENSGLIKQYTTIIDPVMMDKNLSALVMISIDNPLMATEFTKFTTENPDVLSCTRIAGNYDYVMTVCTKNQSTLQALLDKLKSIKSVKRVEASLLLNDIKKRYSVPPVAQKE